MRPMFEELDYAPTPIGAPRLRRRHDLRRGQDVPEIMPGDPSPIDHERSALETLEVSSR